MGELLSSWPKWSVEQKNVSTRTRRAIAFPLKLTYYLRGVSIHCPKGQCTKDQRRHSLRRLRSPTGFLSRAIAKHEI